jgi:lysophospholipase L1-like esterase
MKAVILNIVVLLGACLVALAGVEGALRIWGTDVLAMGNQYIFYRFDPVLGWSNLPGAKGQFSRLEYSYPVAINSQGLWDREVEPKREGEFRVAVIGDSFTWGVGTPYGQRFTEVIEDLNPRINVLNFGVAGFAPIQYLLELGQVLALKPDHVVVAFCLGNDISDNVLSNPYVHPKPVAKLSADGSLEITGYPLIDSKEAGPDLIGAAESHLRLVGFVQRQLERLHRKQTPLEKFDERWLYAPPASLTPALRRRMAEMYKVNELILAAIRDRVEAALGPGHLSVLLVPTKLEYGMDRFVHKDADPNVVANHVLETLARLKIPAVDGRPVITPADFWDRDEHWRPVGHGKIGKLLADHLASVMPAQTASPTR